MKKILICSTILTTIKTFMIPHIRMLKEMGCRVDVAGQKDVEGLEEYADNVYDLPFRRTPLSALNRKACRKLKNIIQNNAYDAVHFHTPVAGAYGRWIAKGFRKKGLKVLYTAHGFHFYKGAPLLNYMMYYPAEKFLARYTDILITINAEDYDRAKKQIKAKEILYIPGVGVDTKRFFPDSSRKVYNRRSLDLPEDAFVILSVGELNENKNHETVIRAVSLLNDPDIYYIICGYGIKMMYLTACVNDYNVKDNVKLLGFRDDVDEIYNLSDVFILPSYREGLCLSLMEAMSCKLPVICSNIRGNTDLIKDKSGGFLVSPKDVQGFADAVKKVKEDRLTADRMGDVNVKTVEKFTLPRILSEMKGIYEKIPDVKR